MLDERTVSLSLEMKITEQSLNVLELTQALGNVLLTCKQRGVSRMQFYAYKPHFQTHDIESLVDLPPIHHSHPLPYLRKWNSIPWMPGLGRPAWSSLHADFFLKAENLGQSCQRINRNPYNRVEMKKPIKKRLFWYFLAFGRASVPKAIKTIKQSWPRPIPAGR